MGLGLTWVVPEWLDCGDGGEWARASWCRQGTIIRASNESQKGVMTGFKHFCELAQVLEIVVVWLC